MKYAILGGGLSAISTAFFLQEIQDTEEILNLEKEKVCFIRISRFCH